jgi:vibriolysin
VYVDAASGKILAIHPRIYFAESRSAYSANHGTTLPGTLRRSEGGAATSDSDINAAYDNTGATYEAYKTFWNRDSYDNAGATLISSVHYSTNYCNVFWNSTQMVYGDGNASQGCLPLTGAVDITAHELTHAVTENESGLIYSGESGGLNEALSDIFGAFTEAFVDGGKAGTLAVSSDTWTVGEDVLPPFLRLMNDPAADGASRDYYTSSAGNLDVHYSSGIANLAFYLLSQGGKHPRNKSSIQVAGVGMDKAIRIFYKAQVDILTPSSDFLTAGNATVLAAQELRYSVDEQISVANAWQAVGVNVPTPGGGGGGGNSPVALTNGVPVNGLSDNQSAQKLFTLEVPSGQSTLSLKISGGSGDADLYVRSAAAPTLSSYDCRPYLNGNAETCSFTNPKAGTYYVLINAYANYSGVSLTGTYGDGSDGVPSLVNRGTLSSLSGATGSETFYKIDTPAGKLLTITISGGSGDVDLYTRFGSKPTLSAYQCRPYLNGNNERCTVTKTQAGSYYIMLRGYVAYSGVSLLAAY